MTTPQLRFRNTLTGDEEAFQPQDPEHVTMYVCGPTVYSDPHLGNARPAVVFDVLYRLLKHCYPRVTYARNVTDVDDKINAAAEREGTSIGVIAARYRQAYERDMRALNVLAPDLEPLATEHMEAIIELISALLARGHAYEAQGHVLFRVRSYEDYGRLSRRSRDEMIAGARVEVAPFKEDPADFVLWKPSSPEQPGWESPWRRGRPGWHVECSAMIERNLGFPIDIHGGGLDLVFPHHENELAQGCCSRDDSSYARYWIHNGCLYVEGEKMSKSLGNILLVKDLLAEASGEAIRLAMLSTHYHQPLSWSADKLYQACTNLDYLYGTLRHVSDIPAEDCRVPEEILAALGDDLNTPEAIAGLLAIAKEANKTRSPEAKGRLLAAAELLGLLSESHDLWFECSLEPGLREQVEDLIERRRQARQDKDFATADRLRADLNQLGVILEDTPEGTRWHLGS